jgi:predicted alpha/beta hydrolase
MPHHSLTLNAADGYRLAASHYVPEGADTGQYILLAGATGVPRGFYRRFAEYAASRGLNVITVDFRGLGESRYQPLKGFEMQYADWSNLDLAAAAEYALARGDTWIVGHSLGGHAIGQLPEPNRIQAAYVCGGGAGWHGWMPKPERWRVWALWNLVGPVTTRVLGYMPMRWLGAGEDLPMGVYRDWRRWCANPNYFFDDPGATAITAPFASVTVPIVAVAATDDLWAPPASRDAFFKHYTASEVVRIDLEPAGLDVPSIGHMGYFRATVGQALWPRILASLQRYGLQPSVA